MTRWPWLAALLLLHAGCTSLTAGQQAHLDDWQRFADRVTAHYGVADVTFLVGEQPGAGGGAMRPGGLMTFQTQMLEPLPAGQTRDFLLAHELAHWVLGHAYRRAPDEAATSLWDAQQERRELDANAEAVKILMVGRHWSERRAFFHAQYRFQMIVGGPRQPCRKRLVRAGQHVDFAAARPGLLADQKRDLGDPVVGGDPVREALPVVEVGLL